jgi:hypothetical protein
MNAPGPAAHSREMPWNVPMHQVRDAIPFP